MAEKRKKDAQAADPTPDGAALAVPDGAAEDLSDDALRLRLDEFEGPFEVLLYLIRSQEIDIFDIPILKVTQQYLHFLDLMRTENLDIAGEFLVMAATLIQIKSRMLLPVETDAEDEDGVEEEDPRLELVEKLLEYRRFRDLAAAVGDLEQTRADCFGRTVRPVFADEPEEDGAIEVELYDLVKAVRAVLRFLADDLFHKVSLDEASVDDKIVRIEDILREKPGLSWAELCAECTTRVELVCCLLAILELCRMRRIRVHQHAAFGDLRLFARPQDGPEEPADGDEADAPAA
ncbi:MAG TPA: segregation/condensation protein A [Candidatus Hydrogenedentes bacterium]|nr:segregation/condensation protein A [Candidatus Hydrogenedentota bacterium]HOC71801.1 segregation/condensation protein A [Candidatus Hydrogenedentota bacterium]HOH50354.1 segregation/condensation protein A [Candidatus Hydrogenedentota bacterium]HQL93987.1 segregation/condensation protein A [Candidatus Hydrogenedentota bacterium]HRZ81328.1 segregation/condensation protein A [Candidatus Hydrogenedentota bacterium]